MISRGPGGTAFAKRLRMRTSILAMVAAAAVMFLGTRPARACGQGGNYGGLYAAAAVGLGVMAVDTGLFVVSAGSMLADHQNSRGYGAFEALWTVPQFALGTILTINELQRPYNGTPAPYIVYTAAMGLMSAHAIWTLTREDPADERRASLGVGATWVPVGQLSRPGLGVVGRF